MAKGGGSRRWQRDPTYGYTGEDLAEGPGPLEQAVGRELTELGWREDLSSAFGTLGWQALHAAENIDDAGGSAGYYVPPLNRELRETMAAARDAASTAKDAGKVDQDGQPVAPEVKTLEDYKADRAKRRPPPPAAEG